MHHGLYLIGQVVKEMLIVVVISLDGGDQFTKRFHGVGFQIMGYHKCSSDGSSGTEWQANWSTLSIISCCSLVCRMRCLSGRFTRGDDMKKKGLLFVM